MVYSILIASIVPLTFLFIVNWLNFFGTHRPNLLYIALAWGAFSVLLSYLVDHPLVPIVGRPIVGVRIGPAVEEIFKSLVLLYLVRRADYSYFVDGAIYGFAAGIGFAVAENMLYLSRVDVDTGIIVAITRVFSSSVMHGGSTALVGIVMGGFPLARALHPLVAWVVGLVLAIAFHMGYNHIAFETLGKTGLWILVGIAFGGLAVIVLIIRWGLRRERRIVRKALGVRSGIGKRRSAPDPARGGSRRHPGARRGALRREEARRGCRRGPSRRATGDQGDAAAQHAGPRAPSRDGHRGRDDEAPAARTSSPRGHVRDVVRALGGAPHQLVGVCAAWACAARAAPETGPGLWTTLTARVGAPPSSGPTLHERLARTLTQTVAE